MSSAAGVSAHGTTSSITDAGYESSAPDASGLYEGGWPSFPQAVVPAASAAPTTWYDEQGYHAFEMGTGDAIGLVPGTEVVNEMVDAEVQEGFVEEEESEDEGDEVAEDEGDEVAQGEQNEGAG